MEDMQTSQFFPWQSLLAWYTKHGRSFPWRNIDHLPDSDRGYRILLSEVFSQQTQIDRVVGYYEKVLEAYPTIFDLSRATYEEFFPYYKGLGYYSRAKNLLATARLLVEKYNGVLLKNPELLKDFPGIGPYTARSLVAFTYGLPYLALDTNLKKVFARYFFGSRFDPLPSHLVHDLEQELQRLGFDGNKINNALMDYASLVNSEEALQTEFLPFCSYFATGGQREAEHEAQKIAQKKPVFVPADPTILVAIVHQSHQAYFSPKAAFEPFIFAKSQDYREQIRSYFLRAYGLELSIRPPKVVLLQGVPTSVCFCQIQSGTHTFFAHSKASFATWKNTSS